MACKECIERRNKMVEDALQGRILAAAGHAFKGAAEMVGLKEKTATSEPPVVRQSKKSRGRSRK